MSEPRIKSKCTSLSNVPLFLLYTAVFTSWGRAVPSQVKLGLSKLDLLSKTIM